MDYIVAIAILMCGVAMGALCMHAHNFAINRAVEYERQRSAKREDRLRSERDNYATLYQQASETIEQLHVEQSNAAGYEDGYRACYKDTTADAFSASVSNAIYDSLKNGKSVRMSVLGQ